MATSSSLSPHSLLSSRRPSSPPLRFFFSPGLQTLTPFRSSPLSLSFSLSSPFPSSSKKTSKVSIAPVGPAPPPEIDFGEEISRLDALRSRLRVADGLSEKLHVLDADSRVKNFFAARRSRFSTVLDSLDSSEVFLLKCLVAAGQAHVLSSGLELDAGESEVERSALKSALYKLGDLIENWSSDGNGVAGGGNEALKKLLKTLGEIEQFYDCIGGIIGYQAMVLDLLSPSKVKNRPKQSPHLLESLCSEFVEFSVPTGHNLVENPAYASQAALWGIEGLPELGEIYPLGGAGDRLGLVDSKTGECLPAAMLPYCGRTLLEGLIRDLQAREFLHFKIYGKQCITPVAIMTSSVKNNHEHITALCERLGWFGRGRENFRLFEQPLVPVVAAEDGQWLVSSPLIPLCKPGGHGAIWKLAYDKGIYQWFYSLGRKGATVRQVSNVVAATDLTLLALAGIGLHHGKKLGFASCQRTLGATEGINVLIEKQNLDGQWAYGLTCIEYTEFEKFGIRDAPLSLSRYECAIRYKVQE